jgi:hypothetical protein
MLGKLNRYLTRFSVLLIMAALITGMVGCGDNLPPQEGEIRTWYDLDAIRDNLAGNYTLMNDLESTTAGYEELAGPTANGGKGWQPIGAWGDRFTGSLDGQGYEIRDLFIARPDDDWVGLFSIVDDTGVVRNVGVVNADVLGSRRVGALVGQNRGSVVKCYSTGSVDGEGWVGGLAGMNEGWGDSVPAAAIIDDSYSAASVSGNQSGIGGLVGDNGAGTLSRSYSTGNVTGQTSIGGLVGLNSEGTVSDCYSTGNVSSNASAGGLVGKNVWGGTVSNSYSTGSVTGTSGVGGLVGSNEESTVGNSFWDIQTSGQSTSDGGTGKTTAEMQDIATFTDTATEGLDEPWDITTIADLGTRNPSYIWNIVNNVTYPFLSWQPVS